MSAVVADPAAFVQAAQDGVNERSVDACVAAYAPDAVLVSVTDGAREEHCGTAELRKAWEGYLGGMQATGFTLTKTLISAADDVIVNAWTSRFADGRTGLGVETWRFDGEGRVAHHEMLTFFDVRPSTSIVARARLTFAYPRIAVAFLRATLRR